MPRHYEKSTDLGALLSAYLPFAKGLKELYFFMPRFKRLRRLFSNLKQKSNKSTNNTRNEGTATSRRAGLISNPATTQPIISKKESYQVPSRILRGPSGASYSDENESLYIASHRGDITAVKRMLGRNILDHELSDSLHAASSKGNAEVVLILLEHGVNVNAADRRGNSALHCAVRNGHGKIARVLLEHGADPFSGVPSSLKLAEQMWNEKPLSIFREMVREYHPGKSNARQASKQVATGYSERDQRKDPSRAVPNPGIWPDRVFIERGERVTMPPSDPAYWN